MDSQLIIITPCSRHEDLARVSHSITFSCTWIVVFDATELRAEVHSPAANVILLASAGGVYGKHQINTALGYCRAHDINGFVYVLDDDNLIHENFYTTICEALKSGKKGYIVQQEISPGRVRTVSPDTTRIGWIDQAQFVVHTDLLRHATYRQHHDADGELIESLFKQHADEFEFVHETISYYNRLRWDTPASETRSTNRSHA